MENVNRWEYKTVKISAGKGFFGGKFNEMELNNSLNENGEQGWELVSTFVTNQAEGSSRDIVVIFKRPKRF